MTNTTTARDTLESPVCPKCDSEKVGWSYTSEEERLECKICDPWHLFEPPEHLKGKGPSEAEKQAKRRELESESKPPPSRQEKESWENQLYWLIDDIIFEATTAGGQYFPKRYNEWEDYHPAGSLEGWIESEVKTNDSLSLNVERIQQDLTEYLRSTEPNKTLELIADHQHCWDNILRGPDLIKRRSVQYLSSALVKMFPLERVFKIHTEDCRSFTFRRCLYDLGDAQGAAIKLLADAAAEGNPDVPEGKIRKIMEEAEDLPQSSELRSNFRTPKLWNTLLVSKKRGTRRLVFSPTYELHD